MPRELTWPGIPPLEPGDLLAAAAIIAVRAEREGLPHWRNLADRLIAARDAMGEPEPQEES